MIDYFALALTHALIVIGLLRIVARSDLDREDWNFTAGAEDTPPPPPGLREARRARRQRPAKEQAASGEGHGDA